MKFTSGMSIEAGLFKSNNEPFGIQPVYFSMRAIIKNLFIVTLTVILY